MWNRIRPILFHQANNIQHSQVLKIIASQSTNFSKLAFSTLMKKMISRGTLLGHHKTLLKCTLPPITCQRISCFLMKTIVHCNPPPTNKIYPNLKADDQEPKGCRITRKLEAWAVPQVRREWVIQLINALPWYRQLARGLQARREHITLPMRNFNYLQGIKLSLLHPSLRWFLWSLQAALLWTSGEILR